MDAQSSSTGMRAFGNLGRHIIIGRWFMMFASLLIMSVTGATYTFGSYSGDIKTSLGYDQTTLNLLSTFKDAGTNVGVISGLINEISPPWVVLHRLFHDLASCHTKNKKTHTFGKCVCTFALARIHKLLLTRVH